MGSPRLGSKRAADPWRLSDRKPSTESKDSDTKQRPSDGENDPWGIREYQKKKAVIVSNDPWGIQLSEQRLSMAREETEPDVPSAQPKKKSSRVLKAFKKVEQKPLDVVCSQSFCVPYDEMLEACAGRHDGRKKPRFVFLTKPFSSFGKLIQKPVAV
ncbi:hypothetical protein NDN08_002687 [Rhodosorus marinus]|uniref:Uncharacterized protein n=1 Tax=Rhodosorus marinus TaxID=101924 RepID=A0AAV8UYU0_9RHOD|nr:hypothetical protein NDN08_002687 [Rhodosorus marinus]